MWVHLKGNLVLPSTCCPWPHHQQSGLLTSTRQFFISLPALRLAEWVLGRSHCPQKSEAWWKLFHSVRAHYTYVSRPGPPHLLPPPTATRPPGGSLLLLPKLSHPVLYWLPSQLVPVLGFEGLACPHTAGIITGTKSWPLIAGLSVHLLCEKMATLLQEGMCLLCFKLPETLPIKALRFFVPKYHVKWQ